MKIVTWNVNSVKARRERLLAFLARHQPDVVCLQELKLEDAAFPSLEVKAAGYDAVTFGQKTYNGVAILSRLPMSDVVRGMGDDVDDPQSRLIAATIEGVRVISAYMPNGGEITSDKWSYKLAWLARMRAHLDRNYKPETPLALCGDWNVTVDDKDVAKPAEWKDSVLCHPDARAALEHIRAFGLVDTFRTHHPDGGIWSWWDYRMLSFPKGDGLRIDHIFATPALASRSTAAVVDRDERKGKLPSDHAPVMVTFSD